LYVLATQLNWHAPPEQATFVADGGDPHALPQWPQLLALLARGTSQPSLGIALQFANPALQPVTAQLPAEQAHVALSPVHLVPHPPQLLGSDCSFTHAPPQLFKPVWQLTAHEPDEQTSPAGHALVQLPQWFGSLCVATQTPPHSVCKAGHWQVPPTQACPDAQVFVQLPQ
jgi:hypothetical protein